MSISQSSKKLSSKIAKTCHKCNNLKNTVITAKFVNDIRSQFSVYQMYYH